MIADKTTDRTITGTLTGEKVAMGIDQSAMQHIMGLLTDLYSDPEYAVIREYSTNAYDAHVEAGVNKSIEVTLPSALSPFLRIRDFGIGLSADDIAEIYSQYGASTKRSTNDQVGMLGLGCKSALTYTDQFTLSSVKDGRRMQVAISRDDSGAGHMTIVDDSPTGDSAGTEVIIPVKTGNSIATKAEQFFRYWKPGTVLVNGKQPEPLDGLRVNDRMMIVEESNAHKIVMGNVAYPVPRDWLVNLPLEYNYSLVAYVDIGSVNFPPARESLMYTDKTQATLKAVIADFKAHAEGAIQKAIDASKSPSEAIVAASKWHDALKALTYSRPFNYKYKGRDVPRDFTAKPKDANDYRPLTVVPMNSYVKSRHSLSKSIWAKIVVTRGLWVYGYDRAKFTAGQKNKLVQYCAENNLAPETVILSYHKPNEVYWLDSSNLVKWDDINAVKLPRKTYNHGASGRIPGSYDAYTSASQRMAEIEADDIDTTQPLFYLNTTAARDEGIYSPAYIKRIFDYYMPDGYTLVTMPATRIDKFKRNFPKADNALTAAKNYAAKFANSVKDSDKRALELQTRTNSWILDTFKRMDASKVDDPDLKNLIRVVKKDLTKIIEKRKLFIDALGSDPLKLISSPTYAVFKELKPYPLFDYRKFLDHQQHTYDYLNAAYAARKEG